MKYWLIDLWTAKFIQKTHTVSSYKLQYLWSYMTKQNVKSERERPRVKKLSHSELRNWLQVTKDLPKQDWLLLPFIILGLNWFEVYKENLLVIVQKDWCMIKQNDSQDAQIQRNHKHIFESCASIMYAGSTWTLVDASLEVQEKSIYIYI